MITCLPLLLRLPGALRRSMPNLSRVPSTAGVPTLACPGSSPRCLRGSQSFDSFAGLTRRQPSSEIRCSVHLSITRSLCFHFLNFDPAPALLQNRVNRPTCLTPTIRGSRSSANSTPRSSLPRPLASPGTSSTPPNRVNQSALRSGLPASTLYPFINV